MDDDALLGQLQTDLIAIQSVALAGGPDLSRPVPTCPGWTVADLLAHLWVIQGWVREILRTREVAEERRPDDDPSRAVADFIDGISSYLIAMRAITPDEPCWNFGPPPRLAGFWIRRQAHEHAVHRFDLKSVFGATPAFAPAFAADGVDELLTVFYPRQVRLGRTEPVGDAIRFESTDTGDAWHLGDGEPAATVTADANTLYLGLWKRVDLIANSRIEGEPDAVQSALSLALTP